MPAMRGHRRFWISWSLRLGRRYWVAAGTLLAMHVTAGSAWAQTAVRLPEEDKGLVQWAVALGIIILICIPAFMNPKRTHQD